MKRVLMTLSVAMLAACGGEGAPGGDAKAKSDPALETDPALLEAALECTDFTHPEREPLLLVHGTFTYGQEQWSWNYVPYLTDLGYDVCVVTYPDRGFIDQQVSAEYVVHAVRSIAARSGRKVDMVGHSQGGSMPRWAIRWWPGLHDLIDDFVMLAAPNHGTSSRGSLAQAGVQMPEAFWQFSPESNFNRALNSGDETPGAISYTSIYTLFDELVQPQYPEFTSGLDRDRHNPKVANILIQDVCPGRPVDHLSIGLADEMVALLVLDALSNAGPANVERAGGLDLCLATQIVDPVLAAQKFQELGPSFFSTFPPDSHQASEEPPLKPYARGR
jgi:triacylglycerol lipase